MIALQNGLVSWAEVRGTQTNPHRVPRQLVLFLFLQSEDEALQRALELSLAETKPQVPRYLLSGERGWDVGKGSVWKEVGGTTLT